MSPLFVDRCITPSLVIKESVFVCNAFNLWRAVYTGLQSLSGTGYTVHGRRTLYIMGHSSHATSSVCGCIQVD